LPIRIFFEEGNQAPLTQNGPNGLGHSAQGAAQLPDRDKQLLARHVYLNRVGFFDASDVALHHGQAVVDGVSKKLATK
jgi:hypothetical protein